MNEFICSLFLKTWKIPTPDVCLVSVPQQLISDQLSKAHKRHYYDDLCFGSKAVSNAMDTLDFAITVDSKAFNRFINPKDIYRICLFDNWVHNDDRKPTNYNLIFKPLERKYEIQAIDHAFTFESLSYSSFSKNGYHPTANEHILVSEIGQLIKKYIKVDKDLVQQEQDYFYLCIEQAEKEFNSIAEQLKMHFEISDAELLVLSNTLLDDERNKKVFEEHVFRLTL